MNPRKIREVRDVGVTKDGERVVCFIPYETRPRSAEQIFLCEKFRRANLVEGTLVRYKDGCGFNMEAERKEVAELIFAGEGLAIRTKDGQVPLVCWMLDIITFSEKKGVFYLDVPFLGRYAVAPKGTVIPKKETMEEALAASAELLRAGMPKARGEDAPKAAEEKKPTVDEMADALLVLRGIKE